MSLERLVELSHVYGRTPGFVIGGGGNTSFKDSGTLRVKGSGRSLATIEKDGFVTLDRARVRRILSRPYPESAQEREALVLADLMEACLSPGRPSVETFLHELMDFPYVVHTHPAVVNALTCSRGGRHAVEKMAEAVWVPYTDPGYVLAVEVGRLLEDFQAVHGKLPQILFLENHGLVIGGASPEEVWTLHQRVFQVCGPAESATAMGKVKDTQPVETFLGELLSAGGSLAFRWAPPLGLNATQLASAFTPDHIVYMGVRPLFPAAPWELPAQIESYRAEYHRDPKVAVIPGLGVVAFAATEVGSDVALALFHDAVAITRGAVRFGGAKFLSAPAIDFILNWEAESYRVKTSGA